jgi:hypothetical protein
VQIEQCDIGTFSAAAIDFEPSIRISLAVSDSVLHDNQHGLFAQAQTSAGAASRAEVWRTRAQDNSGDGFLLYDIARAVLVDSPAAGNANGVHFVATGLSASDTSAAIERTSIVHNHAFGVLALGSPTGSLADVNIANSTLAHNETGLGVDNASQIRLTSSQLTDNNTGIIQFGSGESFTLSTNMRYQVNNGASPTPLLPN